MTELELSKIITNSRFVFDSSSSDLLIKSNTVFVNGIITNNLRLKLFSGDFIQLLISLKYYIVYK